MFGIFTSVITRFTSGSCDVGVPRHRLLPRRHIRPPLGERHHLAHRCGIVYSRILAAIVETPREIGRYSGIRQRTSLSNTNHTTLVGDTRQASVDVVWLKGRIDCGSGFFRQKAARTCANNEVAPDRAV